MLVLNVTMDNTILYSSTPGLIIIMIMTMMMMITLIMIITI